MWEYLKNMNNIIVYTSIYGDKDNLMVPKLEGCDFAFFTGDGGKMDAKRFKVLPHKYFGEYEYSMWIDGNIKVFGDIASLVKRYMKNYDIVTLTHPSDGLGIKTSIFDEFKVCIDQKFDDVARLKRQRLAYKDDGCPDNHINANGIIIRRHNVDSLKFFGESWWDEIRKYSSRDQLSFSYLVWKLGLRCGKLDNVGLDANWFRYYGHKI